MYFVFFFVVDLGRGRIMFYEILTADEQLMLPAPQMDADMGVY